MPGLVSFLEKLNFRIPFGRWQLFEFTDLWIIPPFIKHDEQDALVARWTKKIPLLQDHTPAELAADIINDCLEGLESGDEKSRWKVVDIGSGTGGPLPVIDLLVNHGRTTPVPFVLSDINPYLDAWMLHASRSETLSFIPQPVDAANPKFSIISTTTAGDKEAAALAGLESNGEKIFRLFCATFHHFDDETAIKVLKSTMETSDAFAIIELQERTILSLLVLLLESWLLMLMAIFWFWDDGVHLVFTYVIPLLPVTQCLDGLVACLRTRTYDEALRLAVRARGYGADAKVERVGQWARFEGWEFRHSRVLHTWPMGYMNVITGKAVRN